MKEIFFEGRHVFKKKASVLSDGVTAEWGGLELTVIGNFLNRLLLGVFDRDRGCPNSFTKPDLVCIFERMDSFYRAPIQVAKSRCSKGPR